MWSIERSEIMPKRGENIRKRNDGRWEGRYKDNNGKYKSVYGKSYREVKEKLKDKRITEKNTTEQILKASASSLLFKSVCDEWLFLKNTNIKISSYSTYHTTVYNHLIPFWGDRNINLIDFSVETTRLVQQKIDEELSAKSIKEIIQRLKQILKFAEKRYGVFNADIQTDIQQSYLKEIEVLTDEEYKKLTNALFIKKDIRKLGVLLSLYMGLRIGEVCALNWGDIDFERGTLYISKTLQRVKSFDENNPAKTKIIIGTPKSKKSRRCLPIPKFLLDILKSYKCDNNAYILTGSSEFIEPRQYENIFKRYLKEVNIHSINYHALRHTFATRAVEKNVDVKTLSEILGHSSIAITMQLYVHPSMRTKKLCIEKIAS